MSLHESQNVTHTYADELNAEPKVPSLMDVLQAQKAAEETAPAPSLMEVLEAQQKSAQSTQTAPAPSLMQVLQAEEAARQAAAAGPPGQRPKFDYRSRNQSVWIDDDTNAVLSELIESGEEPGRSVVTSPPVDFYAAAGA